MFVNKRQQLARPKPAGLAEPGAPRRLIGDRFGRVTPKATENKTLSSPVAKKTSQKAIDLDDISLSSEDSKSFGRFLKRSIDDNKSPKPDSAKVRTSPAITEYSRPKTSRGAAVNSVPKFGATGNAPASSSALDRLAQLEARFRGRQQTRSLNKVSLSASDFDPNVSSDLEIKKDIGKPDIKLREKLKKSYDAKLNPARSEHIFLSMDAASSSSDESIGNRNKFIKGDVAAAFSDDETSEEASIKTETKRQKSLEVISEVMKVHASTDLDESEASLRRYMKNLDKDDSERPASSKKVTFASDLIRSSDYEQSLDDFLPMSENISSLDEIIPSKMHNIMTLDDLQPSNDKKGGDDEVPTAGSLEFEGLHTVDELLPSAGDLRSSSEYAISMEEDIQAEESRTDSASSSRHQDRIVQLRSVDDLEFELKPVAKVETGARGIFMARTVESQSDRVESESASYSDDFQDEDTLKDTESISQDIASASTVSIAGSCRDSTSGSENVKEKTISSHSSLSYSSDISTSTETPKRPNKPRRKKLGHMKTQTEMTPGAWLPGSVYTDPQGFKPTKLIDNEALDVLTSYNPATLAIQDLLHQQVTLTKEFVSRSRRLHDLAVSAIPCDYVYGEVDHVMLERLKRIMDEPHDHALMTT